ncbi:sugar phosphate isomerase/epimerase family protein [Levilactobacillus andaensis]|uniref:sugar phosphate isomerase/epimerase family protein n=1 Tax=Levilactobacillus andaensis TaxID=2799570 RepID=UPI0019434BAD|nr:TIM barrel protein [Levilactobacillus andaensis]
MDKQDIVLNTLVFDQQHNDGEAQLSMLQRVVDFGIKQAEVRREFFTDPAAEAADIKDFIEKHQLKLFYSVPEKIFTDDGALNPELPTYFAEAKAMGVTSLKMNIGNFAAFNGDLVSALSLYADSGIEFNVENDQSTANGSSANILKFLEAVKAVNVDIKFVFDLGNWRFVNENELDVAKKLSDFTRYIHVKNDVLGGAKPNVVALDKGVIDWKAALKILPKGLPVALEYPATDDEIRHGIDLLVNNN